MHDSLRRPIGPDRSRLEAERRVLMHLSRVLGPAHDLQVIVETVLSAMRELLEFRGGSICLCVNGFVHIAASDPPASPDVLAARVAVGSGISGRIVAEGKTISVPDLDSDPRVDPHLRRTGTNAPMRSYLGVPLVFLGETIGVLQIDSTEPNAFGDEDVRVLEWLAAHVSGAIGSAKAFDRARELDMLKNDFITRVSHELRTPLTVIRGFVATLLSQPLDPQQQADMLRRIAASSARLEDLIEDLLILTAIEGRVSSPVVVDTSVALMIAEFADGADVGPCPADLVIQTDPGLLRRALRELVTNARRYASEPRVRVVVDTGGSVAIEVADDGPGIPADVIEHAGERFLRGPSAGSEPGLGLGLYRVQRIADALGARLSLETPACGGTIARLHLPVGRPT